MDSIKHLVQASLGGERYATARLISMVEKGDAASEDIMRAISPHTGNAYRIGITGPPGAGKSSLVNRLAGLFFRNNISVGIIAVDPTSPFSGGSLLGDRIRMTHDSSKNGVFFRSMSAGTTPGGLSRTSVETSKILDASGCQVIITETVGVGQSELDIARSSDTVMVVLVPESGDQIQVMKAGLMEIADIFVINKSDRQGAEQLAGSVRDMVARPCCEWNAWVPPVFKTAASLNKGIEELYQGLWSHHRYLQEDSRMEIRRKRQLKRHFYQCLKEVFAEVCWADFIKENDLDLLLNNLWENKTDTRFFSEKVVRSWLKRRPFLENGS